MRALLGKYGPVHPIRGMEQPYHYRNKVISTFAPGWGGKLTSGIYAANSHKVLPVESCLLQDEVLDKTMQAVRAAANACRYQPYDEDKGTGLVRHCLLRRGVATGQVMAVLVTAQPALPGAKNFVIQRIRTPVKEKINAQLPANFAMESAARCPSVYFSFSLSGLTEILLSASRFSTSSSVMSCRMSLSTSFNSFLFSFITVTPLSWMFLGGKREFISISFCMFWVSLLHNSYQATF